MPGYSAVPSPPQRVSLLVTLQSPCMVQPSAASLWRPSIKPVLRSVTANSVTPAARMASTKSWVSLSQGRSRTSKVLLSSRTLLNQAQKALSCPLVKGYLFPSRARAKTPARPNPRPSEWHPSRPHAAPAPFRTRCRSGSWPGSMCYSS